MKLFNALVAHSGGPTTVMNASLVGVIDEAREQNLCRTVYGARFGLQGILGEDFIDLSAQPTERVSAIRVVPGSALGTSRHEASEQDIIRILDIFQAHSVGFFFYTGGNGSMGTAREIHALAQRRGFDLQVVGIPKTIDNDLCRTDHSPGFASAARFAACAVRDIGTDNLALPNQVEIVEILGRNAGWLAASTAVARCRPCDAPHLIYFPENRLPRQSFLADVNRVYGQHKRCVVAVCEGQLDEHGEPFGADVREGSRGALAQNLAHRLALLVTNELGLRARSEKPGLLGRSSQEHALTPDRDEAYACGRAAVRAAAAQQGGTMVTLQCTRAPYRFNTGLAPLSEVALVERLLPQEYRAPQGNDVTAAFLSYIAPLVGEIAHYPGIV
jgi:ATP-dependent phosphofructokinase / diphosphate-dependent phosphofructokinase